MKISNNIYKLMNGQLNKYEEIVNYLKQDDSYWLNNDIWDVTEEKFMGETVHNTRHINFINFHNIFLKNELKYYILYNFKNKKMSNRTITCLGAVFKHFSDFLNQYYFNVNSFNNVSYDEVYKKWKFYLIQVGIKVQKKQDKSLNVFSLLLVIKFIIAFYDDREETEKDIWYAKNIKGVTIRATQNAKTTRLNFMGISEYYRETVKRYFRTIITKKSFGTCSDILIHLRYFFESFYSRKYKDGFIENLSRNDIEKYLVQLMNDRKGRNRHGTTLYITNIRTFLEYIRIAQYDKAPKKEVGLLIFKDDIPKRNYRQNAFKGVKFIPEPILKQLDSNIMELDNPQWIPVYILLRETGWRGTDILNLRYDNCIEQIWNSKEQKYNYYLCGEITKTGIAELKIPIRDQVAEMVQQCMKEAKEQSNEDNNQNKYLFNCYSGRNKGNPIHKSGFVYTVDKLIKAKDIRDVTGELYHFKPHALRHTRAKEYVEQGMNISIIQQILGHQSLQMTAHYANVSENTLYEKWKATEDLELFKVNIETNEFEAIDLGSESGENLVRYEYVKKNLDAVKVPFGVCFKPSKLPCKQQMNHCLTCASFCTTIENIPEYEEEIESVRKQIDISERCGRELWAEKNRQYLNILEETLNKVKEHKLVHKNGESREGF
ncbi:tyrosine-type recombinase/integrase [Clostridium intestinale]|uniref:tyrosine-type recombinase/integrase n=1 Tax=Clostridium intestinale TaxID=36845 RepID=UPI002DD61F94|nr:tyrosine-type recombinase/integrase [Clostridium intestinale]WRY53398.1 tyrosine-type recombinase/integrase [Clostridium intestinale]